MKSALKWVFCDSRVLARKLASAFGHPTRASLYASSTCVHLRLLAGPFDQGFKANKKSLIPEESNFRLARNQVVFLETAVNLRASRRKANDFFVAFFSIFELGGITEHSITGPAGNCKFCSPRPQGNPRLFSTSIDIEGRGETYNSLFLLGSVIRCLIIIFNSFLR